MVNDERNVVSRLIGKHIKSLRIDKNISLHQLSRLTGIEYSQLYKIEIGKLNTSCYTVYRIAKALEVGTVVLGIPSDTFPDPKQWHDS